VRALERLLAKRGLPFQDPPVRHALTLFATSLLAPLAALHAADALAERKPNVLFVVFDDLNNRLG